MQKRLERPRELGERAGMAAAAGEEALHHAGRRIEVARAQAQLERDGLAHGRGRALRPRGRRRL